MLSAQMIRVVLWMTGTLLSFSVMAVSVRELAGKLSIAEILSIRSAGGLLIVLGVAVTHPHLWQTAYPRRLDMHLLRNLTHLGAQFLWALGLTLLPFATVFALEFTMPLWTAVLAAFFLSERITPSRIGALACGLIGVLIILRPGFESFKPAAVLILIAAFGYAISNIATKKLIPVQTTFAIVLWMNIMQFPIAYGFSDPLFFLKLDMAHLLPVIGIGTAGLSAHYCLTNALAAGDATVVVPLDFMRLPLIAVVGWAFYSEPLDIWVMVGAAAIIAGVLWNLNSESQVHAAAVPRSSAAAE
ncbi:MAG: DMT family transporter [Xanthobacteraceae bacterium]